ASRLRRPIRPTSRPKKSLASHTRSASTVPVLALLARTPIPLTHVAESARISAQHRARLPANSSQHWQCRALVRGDRQQADSDRAVGAFHRRSRAEARRAGLLGQGVRFTPPELRRLPARLSDRDPGAVQRPRREVPLPSLLFTRGAPGLRIRDPRIGSRLADRRFWRSGGGFPFCPAGAAPTLPLPRGR